MSFENEDRRKSAPGPASPGTEESFERRDRDQRRRRIAAAAVVSTVLATAAVLAAWKGESLAAADRAAAAQPEPMEAVTAAVVAPREHRPTVTAIGTLLATRSVTLRNELSGTVAEVRMTPGEVVEAGQVLVRLDVSVEQAELEAEQARAALAETLLERNRQASRTHAVSEIEVDRSRAERDVALAQVARIRAIIDRKTIRAPFRSRVGIADLHRGQYLDEGTVLTTLQGIDDAAHVDFSVAQRVAARLADGDAVRVFPSGGGAPIPGVIVAVDSRVDPATRNALVRARVEAAELAAAPGASVRVEVPDGQPRTALAVPVSALRKGPAGDHVFVIAADGEGKSRVHVRPVRSGPVVGGDVLILEGLEAGEQDAASGSFQLRESALVAVAPATQAQATPAGVGDGEGV
jgi:membrane fusion protein (multidrug efflux system)